MVLLRARGQKQPSQESVMDAVVGTAGRVSAAFPEGQEKPEFMGITGILQWQSWAWVGGDLGWDRLFPVGVWTG